jgi:hypothetical protein
MRENARTHAPHDLAILCAHPLTKKVVVKDDFLVVATHAICIGDRIIGEYYISIQRQPGKEKSPIYCFNSTRQMSRYHGPHVKPDGTICMVNDNYDHVRQLLAYGRMAQVCLFVYHVLSTTSGTQFPGATLDMWPVQTKQK